MMKKSSLGNERKSLMKKTRFNPEIVKQAKNLVSQMTIEEKASLCSGKNFWETKAVERLGIASFMLTDGPHGLRKQDGDSDHLGLNTSVATTCFPPAAATGCSFDRELIYRMGVALGEECRAEGVSVILGPGANIKRNPLCGRNFEYFSEDPLLSGEIAAAMINGIQSENVGTSMKHYLANNQERARVSSNSVVDERALREIYLPAFENAVKKSQPWTLMCSYNKINGTYASDHRRLMTDIPRGEWGFEGAIVTDWGAMNDRVAGIKAGLDLEMPGPIEENDKKIVTAVLEGQLKEKELDLSAERMTTIALHAAQNTIKPCDWQRHDELAREVARDSAVLLQHGNALPLNENKKLAVIGSFAKNPRYQGAGSSKINPKQLTSLCDALETREIAYEYAPGFNIEGQSDEKMIDEAVAVAKKSEQVVVMLGLPDSYETEGLDRSHMELPESQNKLMAALVMLEIPLVVVISTGSAVNLPWKSQVDSILLTYLMGQNGGNATVDLLIGEVNPSGKLAESWPLSITDVPSYEFFGGKGNIEYRESIYVGYRYYDTVNQEVAYPFGHGLSYTQFSYSDLAISTTENTDSEEVVVSLKVKNTGKTSGKEVIQLYIKKEGGVVFTPAHELRDFTKITLEPGESQDVVFVLNHRSFAYYDVQAADWLVEGGDYQIQIGASSRDIRLEETIQVLGSQKRPCEAAKNREYAAPSQYWPPSLEQFEAVLGHEVPAERPLRPFTRTSTLGELEESFIGRQFVKTVKKNAFKELGGDGPENAELVTILNAMFEDMPIRQLVMLSNGALNEKVLDGLLEMMNGHYIRGLKRMR